MYKVKLLNKIDKVGLDQLDHQTYTCGEDVESPDAILVRSAKMHDMEFDKNLLCIGRAGAGTNNIPVDRCAEEGIVVFNTPGANANAVKELAICGLLMASRKIVAGNRWVMDLKGKGDEIGKLVEKGKSQFVGPEIKGKTLGVVGLGAIGGPLANAAVGLGMKVLGYDPYMSVDAAWHLSRAVKPAKDLKQLLEESDYISLHIPATGETKGFLNAETLGQMKDGVRIVNFARGELVNVPDMVAALNSGKVAAFITDFPTEELLECENVVALPHLGASTPESEANCAIMAAEELREYLEHGNIRNSVNFPTVELEPTTPHRVCVLHRNVPNMVSTLSGAMAAEGVNIETMVSKSRKDVACTILDVDKVPTGEASQKLAGVEGIIRVRVL